MAAVYSARNVREVSFQQSKNCCQILSGFTDTDEPIGLIDTKSMSLWPKAVHDHRELLDGMHLISFLVNMTEVVCTNRAEMNTREMCTHGHRVGANFPTCH